MIIIIMTIVQSTATTAPIRATLLSQLSTEINSIYSTSLQNDNVR